MEQFTTLETAWEKERRWPTTSSGFHLRRKVLDHWHQTDTHRHIFTAVTSLQPYFFNYKVHFAVQDITLSSLKEQRVTFKIIYYYELAQKYMFSFSNSLKEF